MTLKHVGNRIGKIINAEDLDRQLIDMDIDRYIFVPAPFTSSIFCFISVSSEVATHEIEVRSEAAGRIISLIKEIERSYPPERDTDISGIEEIYD